MVANVTQIKSGTMINANMNVKTIICEKKIKVGILLHVFVRTVNI